MKKNYIKPVCKTVMPETALSTMQLVEASERGIGYGGVAGDGTEGDAPERYKDFSDDKSSSTYSLW